MAADMMRTISSIFLLSLLAIPAIAQELKLPPRPPSAMSGSEFAKSIAPLELGQREEKIYEQIAGGNVPEFLRTLRPVRVQSVNDDKTNSATFYVTPDYLAVGSDEDYFLTPLTPIMAQKVADLVQCSLPTKKMVDEIYKAAAVKLVPMPIPPSAAMATVPVFIQHNGTVAKQRQKELAAHPLGALVAGHKKDVVISAKLAEAPGKVAIYGWHQTNGRPIQPLYTGHADYWADYSHGIRLVQLAIGVNGTVETVPQVLADPNLCGLLSDEGPIIVARYPAAFHNSVPAKTGAPVAVARAKPHAPAPIVTSTPTNTFPRIKTVSLVEFEPGPFNERLVSYDVDPEVKVLINAPMTFNPNKKLKLIFYTLPNGNTIEQTVGRRLEASGDNWHFNIQHIGAQTRFLRNVLSNDCSVVVVYLQAEQKSWPAWRKKHADIPAFIPALVNSIKPLFNGYDVRITLSGHSGGGSFIFGYLNGVDRIPDDVERIAFLDSNYAYDPAQGHLEKLTQWLRAPDRHYLSVLAYNDAVVVLNGKPIVSPEGGTWGRSHAMLADMADLNFTSNTSTDPEIYTALNGRVTFLLKENPDKKVLHTVQVEKNGFIQSILSGTPHEGKGYQYFGAAAYSEWIQGQ